MIRLSLSRNFNYVLKSSPFLRSRFNDHKKISSDTVWAEVWKFTGRGTNLIERREREGKKEIQTIQKYTRKRKNWCKRERERAHPSRSVQRPSLSFVQWNISDPLFFLSLFFSGKHPRPPLHVRRTPIDKTRIGVLVREVYHLIGWAFGHEGRRTYEKEEERIENVSSTRPTLSASAA